MICFTDNADAAKELKDFCENEAEENEDNILCDIYYTSKYFDIDLTFAVISNKKDTATAFDFGRMTAEDVTFKLTYDGKTYSGSTNYVQDYSEYTLTVYLDGSTLKNKVNSGTAYTLKEEN